MMRRCSWIAPYLTLITLTCCVFSPTISRQVKGHSTWEEHWLAGTICRPPCWEGITPGKTTGEEALSLLRSNALFAGITQDSKSHGGTILWSLVESSSKSYTGGVAFYGAITNPVSYISTLVSHEVTISDIVSVYGMPNFIETASYGMREGEISHEGHTADLLFLQYGYAATLKTIGQKKPEISPETQIIKLRFFDPSASQSKVYSDLGIKPTRVNTWDGYKSFDYYCAKLATKTCF